MGKLRWRLLSSACRSASSRAAVTKSSSIATRNRRTLDVFGTRHEPTTPRISEAQARLGVGDVGVGWADIHGGSMKYDEYKETCPNNIKQLCWVFQPRVQLESLEHIFSNHILGGALQW